MSTITESMQSTPAQSRLQDAPQGSPNRRIVLGNQYSGGHWKEKQIQTGGADAVMLFNNV